MSNFLEGRKYAPFSFYLFPLVGIQVVMARAKAAILGYEILGMSIMHNRAKERWSLCP